jgi:predicted metal-binding membrane protein
MNPIQRKYGEATTVYFPIYTAAGDELYGVSTIPTGDISISMDGDTEDASNAGGLTVVKWSNSLIGMYKMALPATEMTGSHIAIRIEDKTSPKVYLDTVVSIETYGHANAQHQMDMDFPTLAKSFTTTAAGTLTTLVCSDLGSTNSTWVDRTVLFHGGNLDGRIAFIEAYDTGVANTLTISQIHTASLSGQAFYIL